MADSTKLEGTEETPETKAEWEKWHETQVEQTQQSIDSSVDSFDKSMLTLSSGALGVSLAFIKDIVPLGQAYCISLLLISWVAFASCIVITVFSFQFSIAALNRHRDFLDEAFLARNVEKTTSISQALRWCTRGAITLFLIGLICTLLFVGMNVIHFHSADGEKQANSTTTDARNFYMGDQDKSNSNQPMNRVVKPDFVRGRQPMTTKPTPPTPPANTPCTPPAKKE